MDWKTQTQKSVGRAMAIKIHNFNIKFMFIPAETMMYIFYLIPCTFFLYILTAFLQSQYL
jgi:hypothetical protein